MARPAKPAPQKAAAPKPLLRNKHSVAVHIGDGRKIQPGETIPADVPPDVRKALENSGFFA